MLPESQLQVYDERRYGGRRWLGQGLRLLLWRGPRRGPWVWRRWLLLFSRRHRLSPGARYEQVAAEHHRRRLHLCYVQGGRLK